MWCSEWLKSCGSASLASPPNPMQISGPSDKTEAVLTLQWLVDPWHGRESPKPCQEPLSPVPGLALLTFVTRSLWAERSQEAPAGQSWASC